MEKDIKDIFFLHTMTPVSLGVLCHASEYILVDVIIGQIKKGLF